MTKLTKTQRQHPDHQAARDPAGHEPGPAGTLLADEGIEATQTTVSRDLEELGAVKVRLPGGETAYALPELPAHQIAPEDHLRRVLGEWVVEVGSLGEPRRPAHPARLGPRGRLGSRPQRVRGRGGHGGRGRHGAGGGRRGVWGGRSSRWRTGQLDVAGGLIVGSRITMNGNGRGLTMAEAGGTGLQRRARHVRGRALARLSTRASRWSPWPSTSGRRPTAVARTGTPSATRALAAGAVEAVVVDARHEMAEEFCVPGPLANARYEGKYPLVSALSRPGDRRATWWPRPAARRRRRGPRLHGQGQRPGALRGRARGRWPPTSRSRARLGSWGLTREDCIELRGQVGHPDRRSTKEKLYSIDENLWGKAIECGVIEDPGRPPPDDVYTLDAADRRATPVELIVGFESRRPGQPGRRGASRPST